MIRMKDLRSARWIGLLLVSAPLGSCGSGLSPGLVNFVSGNPAGAIAVPPGSVIVMLINKTSQLVSGNITITQTNGNVLSGETLPVGPGFYIMSIPCPVSAVEINSISAGGTINQDGGTVSQDGGTVNQDGGTVEGASTIGNFLGRAFVAGFNLRCGAVISIKVAPDDTDPDAPPEALDNTEPDVIVEDFQ